jgi:hypothetical protein
VYPFEAFSATYCLVKNVCVIAALASVLHCPAAKGAVEAAQQNRSPQSARQDGRGMHPAQEKLQRIVENGSKSPVPPGTTVFSEDEVNELLRVEMREFIPDGLSDPYIKLIGSNAFLGRAVADLDEYKRRRKQRGGLDPLQFLTGRLPVTARGLLYTRDGRGQVILQAADVNGIPLPPALVREMINALSRSEQHPNGYDIERPFALPAEIRAIAIHSKQAVVIQ